MAVSPARREGVSAGYSNRITHSKLKEMTKKIYSLIGSAVLFLAVTSCDVERFPHDQIEQREAFRTMSDAHNITGGLYMQLRNRVYGQFIFITDVQSDLFNASLDYGNMFGFPHTWEGFLASDYSLEDIWQGYYSALVNINNVIENIERVEALTDEDQKTLQKYLGEAYLMRAFYYHQLVIRWAKPYDAATASADLGVPLVLTYDPAAKPARASVQNVYDQILSDIDEALVRLSSGQPNATRVTRDAALALKARVYLHMENWSAAEAAALELIQSQRYPLISDSHDLMSMWYHDSGTEIIFHLDASQPTELPASSNQIYLMRAPSTGKYTPYYIPQQWVVDLFEDNDIRKEIYLDSKELRIQGADYDGIYLVNKYPGNPALYSGNTNYQHKPIVFRIAETWLNLIEARYHIDQGSALESLNTLRQARGLEPLAAISGDALMNAIREERTRELLAEGYRLNDLMRWNKGFQRSAPQNEDIIVRGPGFDQLSVTPENPRFVWGIPTNDISTNENMVQNPGW